MVLGEKWQPEGSRKLVTSYEKLKDVCREKGERKIAQEGGSERESGVVNRGAREILIQNIEGVLKAGSKDKLVLHRVYREGKKEKAKVEFFEVSVLHELYEKWKCSQDQD